MNKQRRNPLSEIVEEMEVLKEEERECFENLPDSLQESERGQQYEENADDLETACDDLENLIESIQEVINR